jgi:hypothetical protein
MAFIDADGQRHDVGPNNLTPSNQYDTYPNASIASSYNLPKSTPITAPTADDCANHCNTTTGCSAYSWTAETQACTLKSGNTLPRTMATGTTTGVRQLVPTGLSSTCNSSTLATKLDAITFDRFVKGDDLTSDTKCVAHPFLSRQLDAMQHRSQQEYTSATNMHASLLQQQQQQQQKEGFQQSGSNNSANASANNANVNGGNDYINAVQVAYIDSVRKMDREWLLATMLGTVAVLGVVTVAYHISRKK